MEYNTQRKRMIIPEYGRNIQKMIEYTISLEDREKRNKSAQFIVSVMAGMNPQIKDNIDYQQKLYDHMHIISGFRLDIDSPYPPPPKDTLKKKPEPLGYSDKKIKFRHYGRNIENIIKKALEFEDGEEKEALIFAIANNLKKSYLSWNRESVNDLTIAKHLSDMSEGNLILKEDKVLIATSEVVSKNKPKKKKFHQKGKDNNGRRKKDNYNPRNKQY